MLAALAIGIDPASRFQFLDGPKRDELVSLRYPIPHPWFAYICFVFTHPRMRTQILVALGSGMNPVGILQVVGCFLLDTRPTKRDVEWVKRLVDVAKLALYENPKVAMDALALCVIHMTAKELMAMFWSMVRMGMLSHIVEMCQSADEPAVSVSYENKSKRPSAANQSSADE